MRVLVVTSMYLSGNGNWVAEQVRSLRSAGLEVDVVFFDPKRTRLNYGLSFPRVVRAIASRKYDVVHTHHTYTLFMVDLARKLLRQNVPIVLTNHEAEALDRGRRTRTWHPTSYLRHSVWVKRIAARRADSVVFVSRDLAVTIARHGSQNIIPCGVDLGKFRPLSKVQCRYELGIPSDEPILFFPADPKNKRKRFELAHATHEIVRRKLPTSRLLTGGGISADFMPVYYNAADVVLQTSFCEASPTIVKEALACEVPVISTDAGDTREILDGVPYCWVSPEDPQALAGHILDAFGHRVPGAREHLLNKGLELEQVARRLIGVYQRVLSDR